MGTNFPSDSDLLGKDIKLAQSDHPDIEIRIVIRNGVPLFVIQNMQFNRINVEVDNNDIITRVVGKY